MFDNNILNDKKRFTDIIEYLNRSSTFFRKDIIKYLENIKKNKKYAFCSDDVLKEIIYILEKINNSNNFQNFIEIAKNIYESIVMIENEETIKNFLGFYKSIVNLLDKKEFISSNSLKTDLSNELIDIYYSFNDKNIVCKIIKILMDSTNNIKIEYVLCGCVCEYIKNSRKYYNDDILYFYSVKDVINKLNSGNYDTDFLTEIISKQLEFDKKQAGIYEVDEEKVKYLEQKCKELDNYYSNHFEQLKELTNKTQEIEVNIKKLTDNSEYQNQNKKMLIKPLDNVLKGLLEEIYDDKTEEITEDNKIEITENEKKYNKETNRNGLYYRILEINPKRKHILVLL